MGIPKEKIELWHQDIDGKAETFFDWEVTPDYCRRFAEAFGVPIYFQWEIGGFKREMLKENDRTTPTCFELPDGTIRTAGGIKGDIGTRKRFPQLTADLKVRWCSSALKVNVCAITLRNDLRFRNQKTLVLSSERGEESKNRQNYEIFEIEKGIDKRDSPTLQRHVDRFRPLIRWSEELIWSIIEKYRIRVHPCYYMGWNRCSCKFCIFGNPDQFASAACISPGIMEEIFGYDETFDRTMKRNIYLCDFVNKGTTYNTITNKLKEIATSYNYNLPIILPPEEQSILPAGAYEKGCGAA